jgi:hypothetical protein
MLATELSSWMTITSPAFWRKIAVVTGSLPWMTALGLEIVIAAVVW